MEMRYWLITGLSWAFLYFGLGLTSGAAAGLGVLLGAIVFWLDGYLLWSSRKNVIDDNFQIATASGFKVVHIERYRGLPNYHLEKSVSPFIKDQGVSPINISIHIRYYGVSVHYLPFSADHYNRDDMVHLRLGADYRLSADDIDRIEKHAAGRSSYLPEGFKGRLSQS